MNFRNESLMDKKKYLRQVKQSSKKIGRNVIKKKSLTKAKTE